MADPQQPQRRSRRSPAAGERQRDAERTKAKIVAAAITEFAAKGYAAARVSEIADRAGVNKQLISYYFGGKEGLYLEVNRSWDTESRPLAAPGLPLAEVAAGFVRHSARNRDYGRIMVWENLSEDFPDDPNQREFFQARVAEMRRRQEEGEIPADLDPDCLLLALMAAASASLTLPRVAQMISGEDPSSPEFTTRYAEQLTRIVRHIQG
ncbi:MULTISPECIES: TetR/AcrR family transcriptional regulator [unclassified Crossiella]|uniref:TetR/AcrR family transcriptional regulator n=1 Tax=unclassified Crossiella TaxID=2620835 RepID=UPI001FFFF26E|nr:MULTISPECIES: TetR/AcrR family transcriptional regulator [unclassified Crossiella]MCK2241128.1 TetR family transcriptional regulator [Crossiella sp. S99.2]MCK2253728.1 TetR family transcriptional regulator [Crossiella sp. S99.1]